MPIQGNIADYVWLITRWWFWLAFIFGILLSWYLLKQRVYKEVNGKLFVRHGKLGEWLDLEKHIQKEHLGEKGKDADNNE